MNYKKQLHWFLYMVLVISLQVGCGEVTTESTATPTSLPPTPTKSPVPPSATHTPIPPTPTKSPVPPSATPTIPPTSSVPTYPEVLSTYPVGVELSCTDGEVSEVTSDGSWVFSAGLVCPGKSKLTVAEGSTFTVPAGWDNWKGYGTKITIVETVTIDGETYEPGTLLTVDENLEWIEVLSWD